MTPLKLFERIKSYYLDPSRIGEILRRYRSLQKHNTTYLSLNRFFHLATAEIVPEFQNQASKKLVSEKLALIRKEGLEW